MTTGNGTATVARRPEPPAGAVVLTPEVFEATSRRWIQLPALSLKAARMPTAALVAEGYLALVEQWPEELRVAITSAIIASRAVGADADADAASAPTDGELLEERARQLRGAGVWVEIGMVGHGEVAAIRPLVPGEETWPTDPQERAERFAAWYRGVSPEERVAYDAAIQQVTYSFVAAGLITPKLTTQQVERFRDDLFILVGEISALSGLAVLATRNGSMQEQAKPAEAPAPA